MRPWAFQLRGDGTDTLELDVYGVIGSDWYYDSVSASSVRRTLKANANAKLIKLRVNSDGGDVLDGMAIYNLLQDHSARVEADIDGIAASMASVIVMAADEIRIASGAFIMIHNPWGATTGESEDLRRWADVLDKMRDQAADIYTARTGQSRDEVLRMMAAETWLTANDAKAKGFADSVTPLKKPGAKASARAFACMSLRDFKNVPEALRERVEQARARTREDENERADEAAGNDNDRKVRETMVMNEQAFLQATGASNLAEAAARLGLLAKLETLASKKGDELHGVVLAWKGSHDKLPSVEAELKTVKDTVATQELDAAIAKAVADKKLTKAEEDTLRAQVASGDLTIKGAKAMLETKATNAVLDNANKPPAAGASAAAAGAQGAELKHNGKTFAELKPVERASLHKENPELYAQMRDGFKGKKR
jgi:ATP-dependent Clp endopeptidase proteolytic subunit ClpP